MKVNSPDLKEATIFAMYLVDNLTDFSFNSRDLEFNFQDEELEKQIVSANPAKIEE